MITKKLILSESSELLFPNHIKCISCGKELFYKNAHDLCDKCIPEVNESFCPVCGRKSKDRDTLCYECTGATRLFDKARSSMVYGGVASTIIKMFKYGNARYLAPIIAGYMLETLRNMRQDDISIITFAPMHPKKQRERGYNQAELLAKHIADKAEIPLMPLLSKIKNTKSQASTTSAHQRAININKTILFNEQYKDEVKDKSVLLIDDVFTTGTTSNICAGELKRVGAKYVYVLTFASVPFKKPNIN